jgi:AcrR family transcriptional regulator
VPPFRKPVIDFLKEGSTMAVETAHAAPSIPATLPDVSVKRPHRADARRNFDALLAAGRLVFAENGSDASLEDVARRAGVGIGTLYRNFPTRDLFIEALYLEEIAALARVGAESSALEPGDAFRAWINRFVEYANNKHALIDGLNRESELFKQCRIVLYGAGEPVLQRAQAAGEIRADTNISDVLLMVSGIAGVKYADESQRDRVLDLALDGLRA